MEKSIAEIIDGYSIAKLKNERISSDMTKSIYEKYCVGIDDIKKKYPEIDWETIIKAFYDINKTIWKYEAAIRQGLIDDDAFMIATRAVLIREFNQARTNMANIICVLINDKEGLNVKVDHASQ